MEQVRHGSCKMEQVKHGSCKWSRLDTDRVNGAGLTQIV